MNLWFSVTVVLDEPASVVSGDKRAVECRAYVRHYGVSAFTRAAARQLIRRDIPDGRIDWSRTVVKDASRVLLSEAILSKIPNNSIEMIWHVSRRLLVPYDEKQRYLEEAEPSQGSDDIEGTFLNARLALEHQDIDVAVQLGHRLSELRHSSGFEILALAALADRELEAGIRILEEGVSRAPGVWSLWHLLGICHSDVGSYQRSIECFHRALKSYGVDRSAVQLNLAISELRQGRHEAALTQLDGLSIEGLDNRIVSLRMSILNDLHRFDEAIDNGSKALATDNTGEYRASVHAELARALFEGYGQIGVSVSHAWKAIALDKSEPTAARVVREATPQTSKEAKRMIVFIGGLWDEPCEGSSTGTAFVAYYEVVATSAKDALEMICPFEPPKYRDSLRVLRVTVKQPAAQDLKGVYEADADYVTFPYEIL